MDPMLVAFLESIKYTGHLLPVVFLRVFLGYYYLLQRSRSSKAIS